MREFKEFDPKISRGVSSRETFYMYEDSELEFLFDTTEIPVSTVGLLGEDQPFIVQTSNNLEIIHSGIEYALGDEQYKQELRDERKRYKDHSEDLQNRLRERKKNGDKTI